MESVWIPTAGTPAARTAETIAATLRFAADSAAEDLAADRATDNDNDATFGVTITDPDPSTLRVDGVLASAAAADGTISDRAATAAAIRTGIGTPSIGLPSTSSYTPRDRFHHAQDARRAPTGPHLVPRPAQPGNVERR